jgi:8-oxo-dGTP pyrophosphatase MutT (NUDIX family)
VATGFLRAFSTPYRERTFANRALAQIRSSRSTGQGAGILFYATDTERFLLGKRAPGCEQPGTWANFGGGVEYGESLEEGAKREVWEEAGFRGPVELCTLYVSKQPGFTYTNFLGTVAKEFTPVLNDEHTEFRWIELGEFPEELHPKFADALQSPEARKIFQSLGM